MSENTATDTATAEAKNPYGYPDGPTTEPDFLHVTKGLKSWMLTLDHKRIGMMYLFGILGSLIVGGAFALLIRTELWAPGQTIVGQDTYNKFFTLHGGVMVFLVIIPGIPAALGKIPTAAESGSPWTQWRPKSRALSSQGLLAALQPPGLDALYGRQGASPYG